MISRGLISRPPGLGKVLQAAMPAFARKEPAPQWRRAFGSDQARGGAGRSIGGSGSILGGLGDILVPSGASGARSGAVVDDSSLDRSNNMSVEDFDRHKPAKSKEPWHFHILSHKHNTHVTVTRPDRSPIISLSCGNLGFKKSGRKHYDSAYQLGAYVIDKLQQMGKHKDIDQLEVCLRGFGPGRDAVTKVLLGNEGRLLRPKIIRVSDSTRLKFGGTRSKKPRRLG